MEYWYCAVRVKGISPTYSYISDSGELPVGGHVIVPFGSKNQEQVGEVVTCGKYTEENAPYPVKKTKHIIKTITAEEYAAAASAFSHRKSRIEREIAEVDEYISEELWEEVFEWAEDHRKWMEEEILCKMAECYKLCMEHNMPLAALSLGTLYHDGIYFSQDREKALEYYKIAADAGELSAIRICGDRYYSGGDGETDYGEAFRYFSSGALLFNDAPCLCKLGDMYLNGHGTQKNEKYAFMLYERAYKSRKERFYTDFYIEDVELRIGKCLFYGIGTEKDYSLAQKYLSEALTHFYSRRISDPDVPGLIKTTRGLLNEVQDILDGVYMMNKQKGWVCKDYDFDQVYDASLNIPFEYNGRNYYISGEEDGSVYEADEYFRPIYEKPICTYHSKEEFYGLILFGRPIKDVIDDSYVGCLS